MLHSERIKALERAMNRYLSHHPIFAFIFLFTALPTGSVLALGLFTMILTYPIQLLLGGI